MDEMVFANYRPADNNIDAAVDNLRVDGEDGFGFIRDLRNVKSKPYTCAVCAVSFRINALTAPLSCLASSRFYSWLLLAMIDAATFLLTNEKGSAPVSNSAQ